MRPEPTAAPFSAPGASLKGTGPAWGPVRTEELRGLRYACLPGCGFCCTFTPEVDAEELNRLRRRVTVLPIARGEDRFHLAFQGGCGACVLLKERKCTVYEDRPAHCRYFPFHVYFGTEAEAVANYTCRGVVRDSAGDLGADFQRDVLAFTPPTKLIEGERQARKVHAEFERNAREAEAWGDVADAARRVLSEGPRLFDGPHDRDDVWDGALMPFDEEDVVDRAFHLTPDLKWLTFDLLEDNLEVLEMQEGGALTPLRNFEIPLGWTRPPATAIPDLLGHLERLARRGVFAGSVYERVDDVDYELDVADATRARLEEMAGDLAVRCAVLQGLGVPPQELADEAARFYDSAFLDTPTIGGWL